MTAVQRNLAAVDEKMAHVCSRFEQVAVRHDQVRHLADFNRTEPIGDIHDLRRIERDCFQSLSLRQTKGGSHSGVEGKIANIRAAIAAGNAKAHAGLLQLGRVLIKRIVKIVFAGRQVENAGQDHRNILLFQESWQSFPHRRRRG